MVGFQQPGASADAGGTAHLAKVTTYGILYIVCSSGLIAYNKYLIDVDRFPYAISLVFMHAVFCSTCAFLLYLVAPSLFPSLTDPAHKVAVDKDLIFRGTMPIAILFSAQLVLSNTAYLHSSVAFLQMMKEANLVLVYVFSLIAALEKFSWRAVAILAFVIGATSLTIHGEVNFSMTGFIIQAVGQLFECVKIVMQAMLLSNAGRKLDAMTYVLLVMPLCAVFLGLGICVLTFFPHEHFLTPEYHHLEQWWPHLLLNACIAFALNVVIALFVKHSSGVSFVLAGILKDAMIVAAGAFLLKEVVSLIQTLGFFLQCIGVLLWGMMKNFHEQAERWENELLYGNAKGRSAKGQYGSTEEATA